jgi:hypothetical protein
VAVRRLLAVVLLVATGGCSFLFVEGPPREHRQMAYFDCTESRLVPILETILVAAEGLYLSAALRASDAEWEEDNDGLDRDDAIALSVVRGSVFATSAVFGYVRSSDCREAKAELAIRRRGGQSPAGPMR